MTTDDPSQPKSDSYSADQIKVLEGLDAVRKRPAMYIGSTGVDGLHHLVYEVVDNSVDEHMAGFGETIEVTIHIDGSITGIDNGRGIPTGMHPTQKKSAAEVALTVLHAGGKFEQGAYTVSGGLHGVGISVVNALSEWLELEIWQDGQVFEQRYERGKPNAPLNATGKTKRRGTKVRFKPDGQIFETLEFSFDVLAQRLRELAFLNKGLAITLRDERKEPAKEQVFLYKGGIVSFVEHLNEAKTPLHKPIYVKVEKPEMILEVALQYNDSYAENLFSFANNINTVDGGTLTQLTFDGVSVADVRRLDSGNQAAALMEHASSLMRLGYCAEMVGLMREVFRVTLDYLKLRKQFGVPIGSFQAIQHRAATLQIEIMSARSLVYEACGGLGTDREALGAAVAKARVSEVVMHVVKEAVQMHGAIGYTDEHDVSLYFRRAMSLAAAGGDTVTCLKEVHAHLDEAGA